MRYLTETTGKGGNVTELDKEIIRVLKDEKDVSDVADILGSSGHGIKKTKGMNFLIYLIFYRQMYTNRGLHYFILLGVSSQYWTCDFKPHPPLMPT